MQHDILFDIVIIFALATGVNFLFNKLKIPTVIGYLFTGILVGPHFLGLIHNAERIDILAEIGVIFLLFTIGMEFSLKHLLRIRRVVFLGGFLQVAFTVIAFYFISYFYSISWQTAIFISFLTALSSSALVLKLLQERSELTSNYGRSILGILIFQDLLLVPLLLFTDFLGSETVEMSSELLFLGLKAIAIIAFVYVGNKWVFPKLLHIIAMVKNQELFMMSIVLICFAIALLTYNLGMSLAFGAFLAGLMISESEYSHNAFGNLIPFKDTFTSFFFVSIGMLLNMQFVLDNIQIVVFSVLAVLVIKTIIASITGFMLGHTLRGTILIGLALSQVGEFSFILAKKGYDLHILDSYYHQLFLAVAILTMALTPFMIFVGNPLSKFLYSLPFPNVIKNGLFPLPEQPIPPLQNHLVIIGKDSSALQVSKIAKFYSIDFASIIFDPVLARDQVQKGINTVYGDAINEPILLKAHIDLATVAYVSVGDLITSMAITERIKHINKKVYVIVRTKYVESIKQLYSVGADEVIPEKFELSLNAWNRILIKKLYPSKEINSMISHLRSMNYGDFITKDSINKPNALQDIAHINITAITIEENSLACNKTLKDINLRQNTGTTMLAIKRGYAVIEHLEPDFVLHHNDIAYVMGNAEQTNKALEFLTVTQE